MKKRSLYSGVKVVSKKEENSSSYSLDENLTYEYVLIASPKCLVYASPIKSFNSSSSTSSYRLNAQIDALSPLASKCIYFSLSTGRRIFSYTSWFPYPFLSIANSVCAAKLTLNSPGLALIEDSICLSDSNAFSSYLPFSSTISLLFSFDPAAFFYTSYGCCNRLSSI